jgi:hypothetical protein
MAQDNLSSVRLTTADNTLSQISQQAKSRLRFSTQKMATKLLFTREISALTLRNQMIQSCLNTI